MKMTKAFDASTKCLLENSQSTLFHTSVSLKPNLFYKILVPVTYSDLNIKSWYLNKFYHITKAIAETEALL